MDIRTSSDSNIVIGGDFNSHHVLWSKANHANTHQTTFTTVLSDADLSILNDGSITHIADNKKHRNSAIDITLCNPELASKTTWQTLPEYKFNSDHIPLLTSIDIIPTLSEETFEPQYNYDKANWDLFKSKLLGYTVEDLHHTNNDIYFKKINDAIDQAAQHSIPLTKPPKKGVSPNAWWNDDCNVSKKNFETCNKNNYMYYNGDTRNKVTEAKQQYEITIAKAKLQHWEHYVNSKIHDYRDIRHMWHKLRKFKKRRPINSKIRHNGVDYSSDKDKARILGQHIAINSQNDILSDK